MYTMALMGCSRLNDPAVDGHGPPVQRGLRLRQVRVADVGREEHDMEHAARVVDVRVRIGATAFEQQHARILAQPVGERASGRASADDDVVER